MATIIKHVVIDAPADAVWDAVADFVGIDHQARRLAYAVRIPQFAHHNASFQVSDEGGGRSRLTWTADVLPDEMTAFLEPRLDAGLAAARGTLGRVPA